jgi:hypothetical protein
MFEKQIAAAEDICRALVSLGVDVDIALHQGFVLVERFTSDASIGLYAGLEDDQLIVLQQAYINTADKWFADDADAQYQIGSNGPIEWIGNA